MFSHRISFQFNFVSVVDQSVEERYDPKATIGTSQLPIKAWYDAMQDPTLADAILYLLVHNAYKRRIDAPEAIHT